MDTGERFEPLVRAERLSDVVANQLLESIVSQRMTAGSRLPSERELGEQFHVSRTVVREAVRHLAAKGVLEVRSGSGARVARVDLSSVSASLSLVLRRQGLDYAQVNEVRMTIETRAACLAAQRAEPADVETLRASCDRLAAAAARATSKPGDWVEEVAVEDVEFHRELARATHNPLYLVMLDSIGGVLLDIRRATVGIDGRAAQGVDHHRRILEHVASGDYVKAEIAMRDHLEEAEEAWRALDPPPV